MSLADCQFGDDSACFPRVSGDEPYDYRRKTITHAFSPRERG